MPIVDSISHKQRTMRIGNTRFWTPQRLLGGFVLASVLVHVAVFVWMPAWQRRLAEAPVPVLDVVLVAAAPQLSVAEPATVVAPVPVVTPQRRIESKKADPLSPAVLSAPSAADTAPAVAASSAEAPRAAVEAKTSVPSAEPAATPPLFNAAYLRNPAPVYPAIARRSGDQGTVMLKVLVNPEGAPVRVELDQSSGSKPLDSAALDAVKGWRFVPARRGAQNIEGWVRVPVVFKLES